MSTSPGFTFVGKVFPTLLILDLYWYTIYFGKKSVFDCLCFLVSVLRACLANANSTSTHFAADVGSVCDKALELRDAIKGTISFFFQGFRIHWQRRISDQRLLPEFTENAWP